MKTALSIVFFLFVYNSSIAQSKLDLEAVKKACMNYIEGFYEGDTLKLTASLTPKLHKFGFWKSKDSGKYEFSNYMSFDEAKAFAKDVLKNKEFPKPDAPKKIEVLDIMNHIAAAKVTAWWGTDYILLFKKGNNWMIEQVLWEGPLME